MHTKLLLTSATFAWTLAASAFAGDALWVTDFEKAKTTAAAEGKDLLMDFTGSDWCGWCIKLREEVFSLEGFKAAAPKSFVLVELDYPRDKSKLSAETIAQNETLQKQFAVRGYPTILLADASGRPYAQTGYQPGGDAAYLKHLDELRAVKTKRDEAWKKAETAEGAAKAALLGEGLKALDADLAAQHYKPVIDEVAKLDPKDATGVGAIFAFKADFSTMQTKLQAGGPATTTDAARKEIDEFLAAHPKATAQQKQEVLMGLLSFCRPPKDNEIVLKLMTEVKALDADSELGKRADGITKTVEEMNKKATEKPAAEEKAEEKKKDS